MQKEYNNPNGAEKSVAQVPYSPRRCTRVAALVHYRCFLFSVQIITYVRTHINCEFSQKTDGDFVENVRTRIALRFTSR